MRTHGHPDYLAAWWAELRGRKHGQRIDQPSTWRESGLCSAARLQLAAHDAEGRLATALDAGAHLNAIEALLADVEAAWARAAEAFLREASEHAA